MHIPWVWLLYLAFSSIFTCAGTLLLAAGKLGHEDTRKRARDLLWSGNPIPTDLRQSVYYLAVNSGGVNDYYEVSHVSLTPAPHTFNWLIAWISQTCSSKPFLTLKHYLANYLHATKFLIKACIECSLILILLILFGRSYGYTRMPRARRSKPSVFMPSAELPTLPLSKIP